MNKRKYLFLRICFLLPLIDCFGQDTIFYDRVNHCSFDIPPGWNKISKDIFDRVTKDIERVQGRSATTNFSPAIQYGTPDTLKQPYILIHVINEKLSWNEFHRGVSSIEETDVEYARENVRDFLYNLQLSNTYLDYEKKFFMFSMEAGVVIAGKTRLIGAMFLGRNGIVQLNINVLEDSYIEYLPDILLIINSFKFDNGYEYK
jgi:hypothetical protein